MNEMTFHLMYDLLKLVEYTVFGYMAISCLYIFVFSVAGLFYRRRHSAVGMNQNKIAVLIPAYKEDGVIVEVAKTALEQHYPSAAYDVIIIADTLQKQTLSKLKELPIKIIEVAFESSTKSKALNAAMAALQEHYDYAVILDADNIMAPDFLVKMNAAFENGYQIVQGHRKAKNRNTSYAILDGISEEINNHIFRKGHRVLSLSSGLIGSGMGFDYHLFKTMMQTVNAVGGFDKELEFKFAGKRIKIEYLEDAVVYDEKIQKASDFSKQRRRWLATQFIYLKTYVIPSCRALIIKGNIDLFDKAFQMVVPPRLLLIGMTFLISSVYAVLTLINIQSHVKVELWFLNLGIGVMAFLLAIPKASYNRHTLKAMLTLPSAFMRMLLLLFKLKGANQKFIHTVHGTVKN